jgi:hypothetical protein
MADMYVSVADDQHHKRRKLTDSILAAGHLLNTGDTSATIAHPASNSAVTFLKHNSSDDNEDFPSFVDRILYPLNDASDRRTAEPTLVECIRDSEAFQSKSTMAKYFGITVTDKEDRLPVLPRRQGRS